MNRIPCTCAVTLLSCCLSASAQPVLYVDTDATGANDGSNWCNAYNELFSAINNAEFSGGDVTEIWVAEGTYRPAVCLPPPFHPCDAQSPQRSLSFRLVNDVAIKGGYAGCAEPDPDARDIDLHLTILSGDLEENDVGIPDPTRDENSIHVVTAHGTEADPILPTAVLDGFTITGGNADGTGGFPQDETGGGLQNLRGSPTVISCTFEKNTALAGAGILCEVDSHASVINCVFRDNIATDDGGGMLTFKGSVPELTNCRFERNRAGRAGGGLCVLSSPGDITISGCDFTNNVANTSSSSNGGGGVALHGIDYTANVTDCDFRRNAGNRGGGLQIGSTNGSSS